MSPSIPHGQTEPVRVYLERKGRGGKSVSVIKGVQSHPDGKKAILKHLQAWLGREAGGAQPDSTLTVATATVFVLMRAAAGWDEPVQAVAISAGATWLFHSPEVRALRGLVRKA